MVDIKDIATASIDPESTVNVRKSQVEEGVEKLKSSIAEHGFWENCPIVIRPHPDRSSEYEYESVVGQCRLKACLELNIERIPAVVRELDDDDAIQQSWVENESRNNLTIADRAFWAKFYVTKYLDQGKNKGESRRLAGEHLGVTAQTIIRYMPLAALPDDVAKRMEEGNLKEADAVAIVQSCVDAKSDELEQKIRERAEWIEPLDIDHKKDAREVLKVVGAQASIDDLDKKLAEYVKTVAFTVDMTEDIRRKLMEWGDKKGLKGASEAVIIRRMIFSMLSGE